MKGYTYFLSQPSSSQNAATITEGEFLYSDRTGIDANPNSVSGYRTFSANANKLVSVNQKYILVLQMDGNLQVRTGNFNSEGNLILPDGRLIIAPNELGPAREIFSLGIATGFKDLGYANGPYALGLNNTELILISLKTGKTVTTLAKLPLGGKKFLFLENSGDLVVTSVGKNIWRLSKGNIDEVIDPSNPNPDKIPGLPARGPSTPETGTIEKPNSFPLIYILGAGLAAYFFFFKNAK